jgi:L-histidine Nalpha-methyltransferase
MPDDAGFPIAVRDPEVTASALAGLLAARKTLPAKLFYDEEGCRLFYKITELPEYYLTRAERGILRTVGATVADMTPAGSVLVEYGASDEAKAIHLLERRAAGGRAVFGTYVPIDVAAPSLWRMKARLAARFPNLRVTPLVADFNQPMVLPAECRPAECQNAPAFGFFPGSTIGNLEPGDARRFLLHARQSLGAGARFLLGMDLRKDPAILVPAYDDRDGVTAAFNLNLLVRLNREAGADFDLFAFDHRAVWNDAESRIEMHLVSRRVQDVRIGGHTIRFDEGETIHTENSYKYTIEAMLRIAGAAGWRKVDQWLDRDERFAVILFGAAE